jgi:hypothetical protein
MQTAIETTKQAPAVPALSESAAIIQVIERAAMNPNVDIDKMERLLQMQERIMERNAKAAYAAAFSEMQPELPEIPENGKGHNNASYALWEDINDLIKPVIARHGFGISFQTGRDGPNITVTAILTHREGHGEQTTMILPVDASGSKNAVQAVGSSTSYGKRYTASALLNLTSRHEDDDGKASGPVDRTPPPSKSSMSLKKKDENGKDSWDRLVDELRKDFLDCKSTIALRKLRGDYREKAREQRWPRAWLEALGNEFDTHEEALEKAEKASKDSYGNRTLDLNADEVPF